MPLVGGIEVATFQNAIGSLWVPIKLPFLLETSIRSQVKFETSFTQAKVTWRTKLCLGRKCTNSFHCTYPNVEILHGTNSADNITMFIYVCNFELTSLPSLLVFANRLQCKSADDWIRTLVLFVPETTAVPQPLSTFVISKELVLRLLSLSPKLFLCINY